MPECMRFQTNYFNPDDMNGALYNIFFPVDMFENDADKMKH